MNTGLSCKNTPTHPKMTERISISCLAPQSEASHFCDELLSDDTNIHFITNGNSTISKRCSNTLPPNGWTAATHYGCTVEEELRAPVAKPGNSVMTHCRLQCVSCRTPRPHPSTGAKSCCVATNPSSPSIQSWHIAGVSSTARSCVEPHRRRIAAKTSRPIPHCQSPRLVCRQFCWSQAL